MCVYRVPCTCIRTCICVYIVFFPFLCLFCLVLGAGGGGFIKGTGDVTNFDILDSRDQDITNAIISKQTPPATSLDTETGKYP